MNHVFLYTMWVAGCVAYLGWKMAPGYTVEEGKPVEAGVGGNVLMGETLGLAILVALPLTRTTYLNIVADQAFDGNSGLFARCHTEKMVQE